MGDHVIPAFSIGRLILAVIVGVITAIVLVGLVGPLLVDLKIDFAVTVGKFFVQWGSVLGLVAGLWFYFKGGAIGGIG